MAFNKDFMWGAATSAYQIEGAAFEDDKSLSIWDVFTATDGKIKHSDNGNIACDHYHRYKEDVALMEDLKLKAYRFSFSWARVFDFEKNRPNEKGLDFYRRLVDELLEKGITPFATLFHWDLPYALYEKGGFLNRNIVDSFSEYAALISKNFSDTIENYFTFNEPQCITTLGYNTGVHAPGLHVSRKEIMTMSHNILLAHGQAVRALRANAKRDIKAGIAQTSSAHYPLTDSAQDIKACEMAQLDITDKATGDLDSFCFSYWNDPIYLGDYPKQTYDLFEKDMPKILTDDFKIISEKVDYHAHNIYNGRIVKATDDGSYEFVARKPGFARTALDWPVTPKSLYNLPLLISNRYNIPLYITENGTSCTDAVCLDGKIHDPERIDFIQRYLRELSRASDDGADIRGYFYWSLLDNFEWHSGYTERLGLVHIDYETQKRTKKDSFNWYRDVILSNGENL